MDSLDSLFAQRPEMCHHPGVAFTTDPFSPRSPLDRFNHLSDGFMLARNELALAFQVHPQTVGTWAGKGPGGRGLPCIPTPGGRRRYPLGEVRKWYADQMALLEFAEKFNVKL